MHKLHIRNKGKHQQKKVPKKLKKKMKLENAVLDMMKLEIDPDLIKYNEMKYTIVKVIKDLCSNKNSKMKKTPDRWKKPMWKEKTEEEMKYMQDELSIFTELEQGVTVRGKACRKLKRK